MDMQSPLGTVDNFEFEKKVDIDTLVLYSNPIETERIENYGIKKEPLEVDEEIICHESVNDESKHFKLKMEEDILKLFMELEKEKLGNPMLNFGPATFMRIRKLSEEFQLCHDKLLIKFLESTTNELNNIKLELEMAKSKIQEFEINKSEIGSQFEIKKDIEIAEVKNQELLEKNPEFGIKSKSNKRKRQNFENQSGEKETIMKPEKKRVMKYKKKNYRKTNVKAHKCPKCDLKFAYQKDLQRHVDTVHDGKKPYKCDLCNSDYKRKDQLEKHNMIAHEEKNPFQCHICSANFVNKKALKSHIKNIHEGIKPSILNAPIKVRHEIERQLKIEGDLKSTEVKSWDLLQKNPFVIKFKSRSDQKNKSNFENQKTRQAFPYLQFDFGADPELIAEKMIEGVNIPGMGRPIPVDSSSLPEGWEKRVYQRSLGITKGKIQIFLEGHHFLRNLHCRFVLCCIGQIYSGDFAKLCGLIRLYEL